MTAQRSVLTAGVMIALALVPVIVAGTAVLGVKQAVVHRRAAVG